MSKWIMCCLVVAIACGPLAAQDKKEEAQQVNKLLENLRAAMQTRDYAAAVKSSEEALKIADAPRGYLLYMQSLAQFYMNALDAAEKNLKVLLASSDSGWQRKGKFLLGRIYLKRKDYAAVQKIYAEEANFLHAADRKKEIAGIYIQFAEALSRQPSPEELESPPADYYKAYALYQKALELKPGDKLSDEIAFRLGKTMFQAQNWDKAREEFASYLATYDPAWQGYPGELVTTAATQKGEHREEARYALGDCLLKRGYYRDARHVLQDFLLFLDSSSHPQKDDFRRDALWAITRSYRLPNPESGELSSAIASLRAYLEKFPESIYSVTAAYEIAAAYMAQNRSEEAIEALQVFLAGKGYRVLGAVPKEYTGELPLAAYERLRKEGTYNLGRLYFGQKLYVKAIEVWNQYTAQFADGPHWSASQQGILDAEYQTGEDLIAAQKYADARAAWEKFMAKYPLDGRTSRILYVFGQIKYQFAQTEKELARLQQPRKSDKPVADLFRETIAEWERLISKYPGTEEAQAALFMSAQIYEEELKELTKALETYRRASQGKWYYEAQARIQRMTAKELTLSTERIFRTNEPARVKVALRNVKSLNVQIYKLNMEEYFRKEHKISGVENLDIALIEPDKSWDVKLDKYADYLPMSEEIPVAMEGPGVYAVRVSDGEFEATTLLVRSDLDLVIKSSRREVLVFVQNMRDGKTADKVNILVSDGKKVLAQGQTNVDGVFLAKLESLRDAGDVSVLAEQSGHIASNVLSLSGLGFSQGLSPKGYIFTDRPAYRPGEKVNIRAILRDVQDGSFIVNAKNKYTFQLFDPRGRCLVEEEVTLSEFGTVARSFQLASQTEIGTYRVEFVRDDKAQRFSGTFAVEYLRIEKVRLTLNFANRVVFRGEKVEGTFEARYYYGTPLVNKSLRYTTPDGRATVAKTDNAGRVQFSFDTTSMRPGSTLTFRGILEGEGVEISDSATLADKGFVIAMSASRPVVLAGEPVEVTLTVKDAGGKPLAAQLKVAAYRKVAVKPDPVLAALPWKNRDALTSQGEVKVAEKEVSSDAVSGVARTSFEFELGGDYVVRASGTDRFANPVTGETTLFVSDKEDETRLRIFTDRQHVKMGEKIAVDIHSRLDKTLALVTLEGETILSYRVIPLEPGKNRLEVPVAHEHFPNFQVSVAVMSQNRFYQASLSLSVERELKITVKLDKDEYLPGDKAKAVITATDHLGQPVKAEISLALVDEAVFAAYPDNRANVVTFFQEGALRVAAMRTETSCTFRYQGKTAKVAKEVLEELERLKSADAFAATEAPAPPAEMAMEDMDDAPDTGRMDKKLERKAKEMARRPSPKKMPMQKQYRTLNGKAGPMDDPAPLSLAEPETTSAAPEARREAEGMGFWSPSVVTGDNGEASVDITIPEKITEWRITTIGCSKETLVGENKRAAISKKKFFVDAKLPALFVEGDVVKVLSRVHNLSDYAGPVQMLLEIQFEEKKATQSKEITVQAAETVEMVFDAVTVPASLRCEVKVTAQVPAKEMQDAVVYALPVRPWGMEYASHAGGKASSSATAFVTLPERRYLSRWMTVSVGPTMSRTILDMALEDVRPFYCSRVVYNGFASTPSDLLACAAALEYANQTRTEPSDYQRLLAKTRMLVASLVATQKDDGGWSMATRDSQSHPLITARTLWALAQAQRHGIQLSQETIDRAANFLKGAFTQVGHQDEESKAVIQYALSLVKQSDFAYGNRLYRQRASMNTAGLAYTALLLAELDKKEMAGEILDLLEKKKLPAKPYEPLWPAKGNASWTANAVETTALVVLAFEAVRPESPLVKAGVDHLLSLRYGFDFAPQHAKGTAVAALARYYLKSQYAQSDYTLQVVVNGQAIKELRGLDQTPTAVIAVAADKIGQGQNKVEFVFQGSGTYSYSVTLAGFSEEIKDPFSWSNPYISDRTYRHATLEYEGRSIGVTSTSPVQNLEMGQTTQVNVRFSGGSDSRHSQHFVVEESIPAGMLIVNDSIRGNFSHYEMEPGEIRFFFSPSHWVGDISYELAAYAPGTYRTLPTVIRDAHNLSLMRIGTAGKISVLPPGEKSHDAYQMNYAEMYTLGKLHFADNKYKEALKYLRDLESRAPNYEQREVARMLLWIYTEKQFYNAKKIVDIFEILKEKYPELDIPFERILVVGRAYDNLREYERAYLVFQATLEASFEEEARVGGVLEDQGEFLGATDYMKRLWRDYQDSASVIQAHFGLSQALFARLGKLDDMKHNLRIGQKQRKSKVPTKEEILSETINLLEEFLAFYPESPQADDAAFSLASAYLALNKFDKVVAVSQQARKLYPDSDFATSFPYMEALGFFSLHQYDKAIEQAKFVAEGESKDKAYATYILGQIYHARGNPGDAIAFYRRVQDKFPDAREAIGYFENRLLKLPEVSKIRPGDKVTIDLDYRNIKEVQLLVYRVDLMKLYLQQKNLSGITKIHLAGIAPVLTSQTALGDGKDYRDMKKSLALELEGEGAYLVICRGDDMFTSGLILVTPLNMEVAEDPASRRVRVSLTNLVDNSRPENVHVKVIGSASEKFLSGDSDLRGVFVADSVQGKVTVIARDKKNRYAFYRGETWLGPGSEDSRNAQPVIQQQQHYDMEQSDQYDFRSNLQEFNKSIQESNVQKLRSQMRRSNKGVMVEQAK